MKKNKQYTLFNFNSTEEFEVLFKSKSLSVTRSIYSGIEKAVMDNKRTADLFQITFEIYCREFSRCVLLHEHRLSPLPFRDYSKQA